MCQHQASPGSALEMIEEGFHASGATILRPRLPEAGRATIRLRIRQSHPTERRKKKALPWRPRPFCEAAGSTRDDPSRRAHIPSVRSSSRRRSSDGAGKNRTEVRRGGRRRTTATDDRSITHKKTRPLDSRHSAKRHNNQTKEPAGEVG
jgi:hypothetical protein